MGITMKKSLFIIILLISAYSAFGQENRTVRMRDLTDSLNTIRAAIAAISGSDTSSSSFDSTFIYQEVATKAPIDSPTFTGSAVLPSATTIGSISSTEISYLNNVTSNVQTQLSNRIITTYEASYPVVTDADGTPTIVISVGGILAQTALSDLPISNLTQTALNGKQAVMGSNDNYVSDAQLIVIGNTLGVNTGDNATNSQYSGLATSKQDALVSGTNIKMINGSSILGSGNLVVTADLDTGIVNDIIDQFMADSAYQSIYTGDSTDALLTLAATAIQSGSLNSLAELDTQIGITGTASATTYWRGDNSWATIPVDTLVQPLGVIDTVITGSLAGWKVPYDITIIEVAAYTDANTTTFNLEERGEATPNTSGTNVMTSSLVADNDQQETTTFTNASIAKDAWLVPVISATGDVAIFSVTIRYVKVY